MVKRVIGFLNDLVEIKEDGLIFINGNRIDEFYVMYFDNRNGKFKVLDDEYLFLGDNRLYFFDSCFWKDFFIKVENIKGKVVFILFLFERVLKFE